MESFLVPSFFVWFLVKGEVQGRIKLKVNSEYLHTMIAYLCDDETVACVFFQNNSLSL